MRFLNRTGMLFFSILGVLLAGTAWADLTIGNYTLVSSKRVSRVEYEYTYKADITNSGEDVKNVMAQVTSNSPNTLVVESFLEFGDVASGDTATSSDTFVIKHNRRYPLDWSALSWEVHHGEAVGVIGPEGGIVEVHSPDSMNYRAKIEIPAGAINKETIITIRKVELPAPLPGESQPAGPCFEFGPDGLLFSSNVIITLPYNDIDNDGLLDGSLVHEEEVGVKVFDYPLNQWREELVVDIDPDINAVIFETNHFSTRVVYNGGDDHGDNCNDATNVELNSITHGNIRLFDEDYFRFEVTESGTITAYTFWITDEVWPDTYGILMNSDCSEIAENDNAGGILSRHFKITKKVNPGIYYISVSGKAMGYSLSVNFVPDEYHLALTSFGQGRYFGIPGGSIRCDFYKDNSSNWIANYILQPPFFVPHLNVYWWSEQKSHWLIGHDELRTGNLAMSYSGTPPDIVAQYTFVDPGTGGPPIIGSLWCGFEDDDDHDGDGLTEIDGDCNDSDASVYPGAPELCDGIDNQCLGDVGYGQTDEGCEGNNGWATPVMLPAPINESSSDEAPFPFSSGGETFLYFTSNRSGGEGMTDIYVSKNEGGTWTNPINLSVINGSGYEQSASLTADGNELFFHSNSYGNDDIYVSVKDVSGNWTTPQKVADGLISTGSQEFAPFISTDGLTLYFTRRLGSPNQDDVFVTHRTDLNSPWQTPQPVDAINTSAQEIDPAISADGLTLFFSRYSPGSGTADIFKVIRSCAACSWGTPEPLNSEINTALSERYPRISPDGQNLYFARGGTMNIYISTKK